MSWLLSPSSATKITTVLSTSASNIEKLLIHPDEELWHENLDRDRQHDNRSKVSSASGAGRMRRSRGSVCRHTRWGLLPFATHPNPSSRYAAPTTRLGCGASAGPPCGNEFRPRTGQPTRTRGLGRGDGRGGSPLLRPARDAGEPLQRRAVGAVLLLRHAGHRPALHVLPGHRR